MKEDFLVLYDYGQGGVWAFVKADSRKDLERRLPEVAIVDERPEWMTSEVVASLKQRMSFDIDKPSGWLAEVLAGKQGKKGDTATG